MACIIFVNPAMLPDAGMDKGAVFFATCLAAAIGCFIMGFVANYPWPRSRPGVKRLFYLWCRVGYGTYLASGGRCVCIGLMFIRVCLKFLNG